MPVITPTPYTKLDKEVEKPEVVLFYLGLFPVMLSPEVAAELMEGKPLPEGTCREVREYTPFEYDSCLKYLDGLCSNGIWSDVIIPASIKLFDDPRHYTKELCPVALQIVLGSGDMYFRQVVLQWVQAYGKEKDCEQTIKTVWMTVIAGANLQRAQAMLSEEEDDQPNSKVSPTSESIH